ncbi:MAG: hypothetical protein ABW167_19635 [Baekduia sp.]
MVLDVVGAAEAAQILKVEVPRITRWREAGKMPPTVARLKATPLWRFEDIEILRANNVWKVSYTRSGRQPRQLAVAGLSEAAELLKVDKSQIGRWRREGRFVVPALDKRPAGAPWKRGDGLGSTPLWMVIDLKRWRDGNLPVEATG